MYKANTTNKVDDAPHQSGRSAPDLDPFGWVKKFNLPALDVQGLLEARRKDVDTIMEANRQAYLSLQAISSRQTEILSETIKDWNSGAAALMATASGPEQAARSAGLTQHAWNQALANAREIAEMSAKAHEKVALTINKRIHEGLDEIRGQLVGKS